MAENYTFTPPELREGMNESLLPPNAEAAWMLQLINLKLSEIDVPEDIKKSVLSLMGPYITNASMTKMTRTEVKLFLGQFEETWMRYRTYVWRKKFSGQLNFIYGYLRDLLMQNYNKSIEGWQGDHVFERKAEYKIKQQQQGPDEKLKGYFERRRAKKQIIEEEMR